MEGVQVDLQTYEAVVNTLSLSGHRSKVAEVLPLKDTSDHQIKEKGKE